MVVQLTKELVGTDDVTATLGALFGISVHQEVGKAGSQNTRKWGRLGLRTRTFYMVERLLNAK